MQSTNKKIFTDLEIQYMKKLIELNRDYQKALETTKKSNEKNRQLEELHFAWHSRYLQLFEDTKEIKKNYDEMDKNTRKWKSNVLAHQKLLEVGQMMSAIKINDLKKENERLRKTSTNQVLDENSRLKEDNARLRKEMDSLTREFKKELGSKQSVSQMADAISSANDYLESELNLCKDDLRKTVALLDKMSEEFTALAIRNKQLEYVNAELESKISMKLQNCTPPPIDGATLMELAIKEGTITVTKPDPMARLLGDPSVKMS